MEKAVAWCKLANALEEKIQAAEAFCQKQAPVEFSSWEGGKLPKVNMGVRSKMVVIQDGLT